MYSQDLFKCTFIKGDVLICNYLLHDVFKNIIILYTKIIKVGNIFNNIFQIVQKQTELEKKIDNCLI